MEKFSPKKAELAELSKKYKSLEISGVDDKSGYEIVNSARKDLQKKRIEIQKAGKDLRREAIDFQKGVIVYEGELVEMIEPLEKELKEKQEVIDLEKLKIARQDLLPAQREALAQINIEIPDEDLLLMSVEMFKEFFNEKNAEFLEAKALKIKEKEDAVAEEKRVEKIKLDAQTEAVAKAKEDAIIAKHEAEEEKKKAVRDAEIKAEREKQDIIDSQNKEKSLAIAREKAAEEEKKRLEAQKEYRDWLSANGVTDDNKVMFHIEKTDEEIILYKKIATFNHIQ